MSARKTNFAALFFRVYDRKISSGEITFRQTRIPHNDFTMMCTTPGYVPPDEVIELMCETMKLDEGEAALFREYKRNMEYPVHTGGAYRGDEK